MNSPVRLHLGCGRRFHPDWQNLDFAPMVEGVIIHDLTTPLPQEDNSVDHCYSAHVLGHLRKEAAAQFLSEQYRVLKPGGVARFAVPDLQQIINEYRTIIGPLLEGDLSRTDDYDWIRIELHDQVARSTYGGKMAAYLAQRPVPNKDYVLSRIGEEGRQLMEIEEPVAYVQTKLKASHLTFYLKKLRLKLAGFAVWAIAGRKGLEAFKLGTFRLYSGEVQWRIYDQYSLARDLKAAGFDEVKLCKADTSSIEGFSAFNFDTTHEGVERKPESLYLEAIKH